VVAEGRLYIFYSWPQGLRLDLPLKGKLPEGPWKESAKADDVVVCMDAATGRTLWKRTFTDQGAKMQGSGKDGGHYTMAVHGGRAYAVGSAGWMYSLDAASGEPVWQARIGESHKAESLNSVAAVAPAAGVVVTLDDEQRVCAFRVADGALAWKSEVLGGGVRGASSPLVATVGGRELIFQDGSSGVTCLDSRDGKHLWRVPTGSPGNHMAVADDYLVCGGSGSTDWSPGAHGAQGYRISAEGATLLWKLDRVYNFKEYSAPVIYRGHAYLPCVSRVQATKKENRYPQAVVELATGKVVGDIEGGRGPKYQSIAAEGKLLAADFVAYAGWWIDATPGQIRELWKGKWPDYALDSSMAYVCGWLYVRGANRIHCYDLRSE
jgi:PQQ-like domain